MTGMYRAAERISEISYNPEYMITRADSDGWVHFPNGDMVRVVKPTDEQAKSF